MRILAGIAICPPSSIATSASVIIVVSRFDAVIVSTLSCKLKRKSSSIGNTVLVPMTPLARLSFFNSSDDETLNFMEF